MSSKFICFEDIPGFFTSDRSKTVLNNVTSCLLKEFGQIPIVEPWLFIGKKDSLAEKVVKTILEASPAPPLQLNEENFSLKPLDEIEEKTIAVYPLPIQIAGNPKVVVLLWNYDWNEPSPREIADDPGRTYEELWKTYDNQRKALAGALGLAAYCFFSPSPRAQEVQVIFRLYEQLRTCERVDVARFFYLHTLTANKRMELEQEPFAGCTSFIDTRSDYLREIQLEIERHPADSWIDRYSDVPAPIKELCLEVKSILRAVSLNLTLEKFLEVLPVGNQGDEALSNLEVARKTYKDAKVLDLFLLDDRKYKLNYEVISKIRNGFADVTGNVTVLALFGHQGIGKSHLLNEIIRHCTYFEDCEKFISKSGNEETTRHCSVFPYPVPNPYSDNEGKLLLLDVEGLETVRLVEEVERERQQDLLRCVFNATSVPCFLIPNEASKLTWMEEQITRFQSISDQWGYTIQRIFLFHKDTDDPVENPDFRRKVDDLNRRLFNSAGVVKLLNKPTFCKQETKTRQQAFLCTLLTDSQYPKRDIERKIVSIEATLTEIHYCGTNLEKSDQEIALNSEQRKTVEQLKKGKFKEMEEFIDKLTANSADELLGKFKSKAREILHALDTLPLPDSQVKLKLIADFKDQKQKYKRKLQEIIEISGNMPTSQDIELKIKDLYESSWWLGSFKSACRKMGAVLELVRKYLPTADGLIPVLEKIKEVQRHYESLYISKYKKAAIVTGLVIAAVVIGVVIFKNHVVIGAALRQLGLSMNTKWVAFLKNSLGVVKELMSSIVQATKSFFLSNLKSLVLTGKLWIPKVMNWVVSTVVENQIVATVKMVAWRVAKMLGVVWIYKRWFAPKKQRILAS